MHSVNIDIYYQQVVRTHPQTHDLATRDYKTHSVLGMYELYYAKIAIILTLRFTIKCVDHVGKSQ